MDETKKTPPPFGSPICIPDLSRDLRLGAELRTKVRLLGVRGRKQDVLCWKSVVAGLEVSAPSADMMTMLCTIRAHHRGRIHRPKLHATLADQAKMIGKVWKAYEIDAEDQKAFLEKRAAGRRRAVSHQQRRDAWNDAAAVASATTAEAFKKAAAAAEAFDAAADDHAEPGAIFPSRAASGA